MRRGTLVLMALVGSSLGAGCGEEEAELSSSDLPHPLKQAYDGLEAAGYSVRTVATGPLETPTLVVEEDPPVVVMTAAGAGNHLSGSLAALNDVSDEQIDGAIEIVCEDFVVTGPRNEGLAAIARTTGVCHG